MKYLHKVGLVASAIFIIASSTLAQNVGTVTNHAVAVGKGAGKQGLASVGPGTNNQAFMGATGSDPAFRVLVGADLPAPGASSLGGVQSLTCSTSNWFNTLSTSGIFGCSQPNFTDLAGSIAIGQIPNNLITNAKLAQMATKTIKGNSTGGTANAADLTIDQVGAILCAPNRQIFTTGTNATYTTPTCNGALPTRIEWEMVGGGGGGGGSGTTPGAATAGGNTCVNTSSPACTTPLFVANGGALATTTTGVFNAGGTATSCDLNLIGGSGGNATNAATHDGGIGGASFFGGAGPPGGAASAALPGSAASANTGSGGGGASDAATANNGGGGGAGGYCRKLQTSPASSYFYTVGAAGSGGTLGTSGAAGGAGAAGLVIATAYWQ